MSGDGLSDINLGEAVDFHKKKIFSYGSFKKNRFEV
jgi:NDP-sugar pyrophosphorylase family protein